MKKMICLLLCLALTAAFLAGCAKEEATRQTEVQTEAVAPETAEATAAETAAETEPQSGVLEENRAPVGNFEIETPYCMLTYPMTWQEYILIRQEQTADGCTVSFYGLLEGREEQHLFDVCFGGTEGDQVGLLQMQEGPVPVFFKTYSVAGNDSLNKDEKGMLLAMVEDINVIYTGLLALEQFS